MAKTKKIEVSFIGGDEPFAAVADGHQPIKEFLKEANNGWSKPGPFEECLTRYEYCLEDRWGFVTCNVSPRIRNAKPMTVAYWEEGISPIQTTKCVRKKGKGWMGKITQRGQTW